MSEASEGPQAVKETKRKEAPFVTLTENITGIALKTLIPSAAHGREELDRYKGYKLLHGAGAATEIFGLGMTFKGELMGPAVYIAGKFASWTAEARAVAKEEGRVRKAERLARKDASIKIPSMPVAGVEGEPEIIKFPSKVIGAAAKVLLPSFWVAGRMEQKGYRLVVRTAKAVEILGPAVGIAMGDPELAGGTYVGAKTLALFTEAADRYLPKVKEKIKVLKEKGWPLVKRLGKGALSGLEKLGGVVDKPYEAYVKGFGKAGLVGGKAIGEVASATGVKIGEVSKTVGEKVGSVVREAVSAGREKLREKKEVVMDE